MTNAAKMIAIATSTAVMFPWGHTAAAFYPFALWKLYSYFTRTCVFPKMTVRKAMWNEEAWLWLPQGVEKPRA
jgi:hypothetical protein